MWIQQIGGLGSDSGNSIAVDSENNIIVTGSFSQSIDIDDDGSPDLVSAGEQDAYIAKFNPDFTLVWAKSFGGNPCPPYPLLPTLQNYYQLSIINCQLSII
ncbi:MAG TPA: SBBP repeat-containing protein [Oscillatoriaceae cyanobacterium M33_DOE_052]|uniref:Uncharacterized protein n=1 Tax=Planktothricoides sp. SpSt-374 TaxID=2282167 RepID=A0A7C3ZWJ2_9CYAN|nr:SBBP repeat-containing protein [Oscillatoriaceae cyanobacterium M33_DOE_052]